MSAFDGTAHSGDRMAEYQRVASEGELNLEGKARKLEALSAVLLPAETVLALSAGIAEGNDQENLLAVTDHRILILKDAPGVAVSLDLERVVKTTAMRRFGSGWINILLRDMRVEITGAHNASIVLFAQRAEEARRNQRTKERNRRAEEARRNQQEAAANTSSSPPTEEGLPPTGHVPQPAATTGSSSDETRADPPASLSPYESVATELEKLASLMERGLLTPEEFAAQKAKLLESGGGPSDGQRQPMPREEHKSPQQKPNVGRNDQQARTPGAGRANSDAHPTPKKASSKQAALGCLTGIALVGAIIWGVSSQCSTGEDDCAWFDRVARGTGVDVVCVDE